MTARIKSERIGRSMTAQIKAEGACEKFYAERERSGPLDGVAERINLQRDGGHAKPYQVGQVRRVILNHKLEEDE